MSRITFSKFLFQLAICSQCHHQLRRAERQSVSLIKLPKVEGLPICLTDFGQLLVLDSSRNPWQEEDSALYFILMGMPELLLLVRQLHKQLLTDNVLNSYQPSILLRCIIDETLPQILIIVSAVMVGFYLPCQVICIEMKPATETDKKIKTAATITPP